MEAQRSLERVEHLNRMGAMAYKTGLLRWAEEEGRTYAPEAVTPPKRGPYHTTPPFKPWLN